MFWVGLLFFPSVQISTTGPDQIILGLQIEPETWSEIFLELQIKTRAWPGWEALLDPGFLSGLGLGCQCPGIIWSGGYASCGCGWRTLMTWLFAFTTIGNMCSLQEAICAHYRRQFPFITVGNLYSLETT